MLCFFVSFLSSFFSLFVLSVNIIIGTQLQAASIDGLRPAACLHGSLPSCIHWFYIICIFLWLIKVVVVVVNDVAETRMNVLVGRMLKLLNLLNSIADVNVCGEFIVHNGAIAINFCMQVVYC